jgi:hypothetical protein
MEKPTTGFSVKSIQLCFFAKGIHWRFFFSRTKGQTKQNKKHRIEIDESLHLFTLKTLNLTILKQFRHKHSYYKTISHKITNTQQFVLKPYYSGVRIMGSR